MVLFLTDISLCMFVFGLNNCGTGQDRNLCLQVPLLTSGWHIMQQVGAAQNKQAEESRFPLCLSCDRHTLPLSLGQNSADL